MKELFIYGFSVVGAILFVMAIIAAFWEKNLGGVGMKIYGTMSAGCFGVAALLAVI